MRTERLTKHSGSVVALENLDLEVHAGEVLGYLEASFPGTRPAPAAVDKVAGVSSVQIAGHQLSCQVRGPIDDLLTVLAAAHPDTLLSRDPSLEELFLSIYGE